MDDHEGRHTYRPGLPLRDAERPWSERAEPAGTDGQDGQAPSLVDFPGPSRFRSLAVLLQALEM